MGVKGYAIHLSFSPGNGVLMRDNTPKSTRTQGGDPIADYIRADTRLPAYLPYPRFLLKMEISQTAKLLYSLLLDRSTLSQKNKWLDDEGRIYIIYPIAEIAEILDKGSTTIKGALNELDTAGLLERERGGFSAPNRLYVKVPPVPQVQFSDQLMAGSPPLIEPENRPTDGQKTDLSGNSLLLQGILLQVLATVQLKNRPQVTVSKSVRNSVSLALMSRGVATNSALYFPSCKTTLFHELSLMQPEMCWIFIMVMY